MAVQQPGDATVDTFWDTARDLGNAFNGMDEALSKRANVMIEKADYCMERTEPNNRTVFLLLTLARLLEECVRGDEADMEMIAVLQQLSTKVGLWASDDETVMVSEPSSKQSGHVVLIANWLGFQPSQQQDTVTFYQKVDPGAVVIRIGAFSTVEPWRSQQMGRVLSTMARAWQSALRDGGRQTLHVHLFSNLGMITWRDLLRKWRGSEQEGNKLPPPEQVLKAVVLDSCPDSKMTRTCAVRCCIAGLASMLSWGVGSSSTGKPRSQAEKRAMSVKLRKAQNEGSALWRYVEEQPTEDLYAMNRFDPADFKDLQPEVPTLFLYSKADMIILPQGPERYFQECVQSPARRGILTQRVIFNGTQHCMHKTMQPEEYFGAVKAFLKCPKATSPGWDGSVIWTKADKDASPELSVEKVGDPPPSAPQLAGGQGAADAPTEAAGTLAEIKTLDLKKTVHQLVYGHEAPKVLVDKVLRMVDELALMYSRMGPGDALTTLSTLSARLLDECAKGDVADVQLVFLLQKMLTSFSRTDDNENLEVKLPDTSKFSGQIVLICSFGGSSKQDQVNTTQWYREKDPGAIIIAVWHTRQQDFVDQVLGSVMGLWGNASLKEQAEQRLHVHIFSNLGMIFWKDFIEAWVAKGVSAGLPPLQKVLQSVVLDCSPDSQLPRSNGTRAVIGTLLPLLQRLAGIDIDGQERSQEQAEQLRRTAALQLDSQSPFWRCFQSMPDAEMSAMFNVDTGRVQELQPDVHTLFLYSTTDQMIPAAGPERYYMECQSRTAGKIIEKHAFAHVAHCKLKDLKSQEYWQLVEDFLRRAAA